MKTSIPWVSIWKKAIHWHNLNCFFNIQPRSTLICNHGVKALSLYCLTFFLEILSLIYDFYKSIVDQGDQTRQWEIVFLDIVSHGIFTWYVTCIVSISFKKMDFVENIVKVYWSNHMSSIGHGAFCSEVG